MKLQCQNRPAFYFGFAYYAFGSRSCCSGANARRLALEQSRILARLCRATQNPAKTKLTSSLNNQP